MVTRQAGSETVVLEASAPLAAGAGCRLAGPGEVRCVLRNGRGRMAVYAQDGNDTVEMRAVGVAYGGPGADTLSDSGRLGHIRSLFGGPGRDRLQGGPDPEILDGDAGDDRVSGGGGDDDLYGEGGHDLLTGGAGSDRIFARDRERDTVRCGRGRGDLASADRRDRVSGCEHVRRR